MAVTVVNASKGAAVSATSVASAAISTTSGNLLLVHLIDAGDFVSLIDSKGNTPTLVATLSPLLTWGNNSRVYAVPVVTGGAGHTLAFNKSGAGFPVIEVIELTGQAASSPVDFGSLVMARASTNTISLTSATLAQADSMVFAFAMTDGTAPNYNNSTGFTNLIQETDGNNYWTGAGWGKAVAATTAVTFTDANGGAPSFIDWTGVIFAVKAAAGGSSVVDAGKIATAEAWGAPGVSAAVAPAGIASAQAFGAPAISAAISASGIASAQAFGSPTVGGGVVAASIGSGEAFGSPALSAGIQAAGISSAEAFGLPVVGVPGIVAAGIPSGEAWGRPTVFSTTEEGGTGGIDPAPAYRYVPPQKRDARDWLDRDEPAPETEISASEPVAHPIPAAADDALVALLLRSGLSLMQAQEQLAERLEAQRVAAMNEAVRLAALQDEDDIAALLLVL